MFTCADTDKKSVDNSISGRMTIREYNPGFLQNIPALKGHHSYE